MNYTQLIADTSFAFLIVVPLLTMLITYAKKAVKEKNWKAVLGILITYMETAEEKFENGADRKEWVLAMIRASANNVNYDIDISIIDKLIDDLCAMSNKINAPTEKAGD